MNRELPPLLASAFLLSIVSRPLSASPATGSAKRHAREQARLVDDAFGRGRSK
jgi:2-oxoglutarate dehydrogenase E1 component